MNSNKERSLAANTTFVLLAEIVVKGIRLGTILVLAPILGERNMGIYVGLVALMQLISPIAQWGMGHVGVRAIARGQRFSTIWARTLTTMLMGSVFGVMVAAAAGYLWLDTSSGVILRFAVAQIAAMGVAQASNLAAEAHRRSDLSLLINISGAAVRLLALLLFFLNDRRDLEMWSWMLLGSMTVWALLSSQIMRRTLGGLHRAVLPRREDLALGSGFVLVQASATAQTDTDKLVLNVFDLEEDAGVYGPGYRVSELAVIPLTALVRASYADFFRLGTASVELTMAYAKKLTAFAIGYGIVSGGVLFALAPILGVLLGDGFSDSVDVVRMLCVLPLLKGLQYFPANVLSGLDLHFRRSAISLVTAACNLGANLVLVPTYGWQAAAVTTIAAEFLFAAGLWATLLKIRNLERRSARLVVSDV